MKQASGQRLLIIAIACGVAAAGLTFFYLKKIEAQYKRANAPKQEVVVPVVVPKLALKKGDVLAKDKLAAKKIPEKYLPAGVVKAKDYKHLVNRTLLGPAGAGQPLTWNMVKGNSAETFSENIELGKRGYTIKINKIKSFDGLLRPGDHIDLYGNFKSDDVGLPSTGERDEITMPVLQDVVVVAAGREDFTGRKWEKVYDQTSADGFNMSFTTVTLSLTPHQATKLEVAQSIGEFIAFLRHPKDTSMAKLKYLDATALSKPDPVEKVDVVMGADGKPLGKIVGDNVVDENGNIIGKVVDGKPVTFDGHALGTVVKGVDPDDPALRVAEVADVVRDANGNVIGKVVDGQIVDAAGNVIGKVDANGNAVALDGTSLGTIQEGVALDASGNVVDLSKSAVASASAEMAEVVRDADGNVIGKVVNGQIIDENGNVVGTVDENGNAVGANGEVLGSVETVMMDEDGNVVGETAEVVRDADGNVIGTIVDGKVVDEFGNVVGEVKDGKVIGENGEVIASGVEVTTESEVAVARALVAKKEDSQVETSEFVDFVAGGTGGDGIVPVTKVRKE
jgi:Flp pilus assembly protein CpaB